MLLANMAVMKHLVGLLTSVIVLMGTMLVIYIPSAIAVPRSDPLVPVGSASVIPRSAQYAGPLASTYRIHLDIVMRPRNPTALADFVKAVSTPGSPNYHHFLAKGQFGKIFGPTASAVNTVRKALASSGIYTGSASSNGLIIPVTTTVVRADKYFHTRLRSYRMASGRLAFASSTAPLLRAGISSYVQDIVGLDTIARPKPSVAGSPILSNSPDTRSWPGSTPQHHSIHRLQVDSTTSLRQYYRRGIWRTRTARAAHLKPSNLGMGVLALSSSRSTARSAPTVPNATPQAATARRTTATSGASNMPLSCSSASNTASAYSAYTAGQIASAYGLSGLYTKGYLGTGETIALYELAPFSSSDINTFQKCYGTSTTVNTIKVDGGATAGTGGSIEDTLDIEDAIGLAPKTTIDVYEAPDSSTGPLDNYNNIAIGDSAQVVSSSWVACELLTSKSYAQSEETIFEQMAAQGQSMLAAAGDTGSAGCYPTTPAGFSTISCASTTLCWAGDTAGYVTQWNGSKWDTTIHLLSGMSTNGVGSISCPSTTFCMATGLGGSHYNTWSPSAGWSTSETTTALSGQYISALSCYSPTSCWLVDTNGNATHWTGSSWSKKITIDAVISAATSNAQISTPFISCSTSSFCIVVYTILTSNNTYQNTGVTWNGVSWSTTPTGISDVNGITSLACVPDSSNQCWAGDSNGSAMEWTSSGWASSPVAVAPGRFLSAISCVTANLCFALGGNNNLYTMEWNGTAWESPQATGVSLQGGTQVASGVSCPPTDLPNFCMSVLTTGGAISWNGSSWGGLQQVDGITSLGVNDPASDPYVTGVGGTDLTSATSPPQETVWNERLSAYGAGGGGISSFWPMPSWQVAGSVNGVIDSYSNGSPCGMSSSYYCREVPDVSASADPVHGYVMYYKGGWMAIGGTSAATPTWASLIALTDEQCTTVSGSSGTTSSDLGFLNPVLYSVDARTPSAFYNVTSGNNDYTGTNGGSYPAASGNQTYSMAAGLGSPNGVILANALCNSATHTPSPVITSVSPASGYSSGGTSVTIKGLNFASGAVVLFGSITAAATTVDSPTTIVAVTPPEQPGIVTISVIVNGTSSSIGSSSTNYFTFLIGSPYVPITPTRICDTRPNNPSSLSGTYLSQCQGKTLGPGATLTITVSGLGQIPLSATGAMLIVTAIGPTKTTYLTVYPASARTRPTASSVNAHAGTTIANSVDVALPSSGPLAGMIKVYNLTGDVNIIIDVEGYMSASNTPQSSLYHPLTNPSRLVDTRCSIATYKSAYSNYCNTIPPPNNSLNGLQTGEVQTIRVSGLTGLPASGLAAVVLNITATYASAGGYFTLYPSGTSRPIASSLNWASGKTVANQVIVQVGENGDVALYASAPVQAVADVSGYFTSGNSGNHLVSVSPVRICDTRPSNPSGLSGTQAQCNGHTLAPDSRITVKINGTAGLPSANISAAIINLTATGADSSGYLSVNPASTPPETSDVNWTGPESVAIPNMVVATVNSAGYITIYNGSGLSSVNVIVDVTGYLTG